MILNNSQLKNFVGNKSSLYETYFKEANNFINKENFRRNPKFIEWKTDFMAIYGSNSVVNSTLFLNQIYVYIILKLVYLKILRIDNFEMHFPEMKKISWFIKKFPELYNIFNDFKRKLELIDIFEEEDLFQLLYQNIISTNQRYKLGEYYTSTWLSDLLIIESSFQIGEQVLDPACGSGTFIFGLYKRILNSNLDDDEKIDALKKIYGYDINPLAIACTKLNCLIILYLKISNFEKVWLQVFQNFELKNCLEENNGDLSCDLIIGNPPWLTYKELPSDQQENILNLAKKYKINPESKNIANLEISTIFFYRVVNSYLKNSGRILFLTTQALMNGTHAAKFRRFEGFSDVILYIIKDRVFSTDTIAWLGVKSKDVYFNKNERIKTKIIEGQKVKEELNLYPLYKKGEKVGKFVLKKHKLELGEIKGSAYEDMCYRGFSAFPRIFFFISKKNDKNGYIFKVDDEILGRSKGFWRNEAKDISKKLNEFYKLNTKNLEKYIFSILMSRNFDKFNIINFKTIILPITQDISSQNYQFINLNTADKEITQFYELINSFWQNSRSSNNVRLDSIFKRLNYQNDLLKEEMFSPIKVVYNEAGSNLKSVVLTESSKILIDITLYYIATQNLNEAHYLCSIFNSDSFNDKLKILKSDRHFHKRPVTELYIPKFDQSNQIHLKLAEMSKTCHRKRIDNKSIHYELDQINQACKKIF
ncbi:MAG: hypothetical protein EAX96_14315 [Candidatus Lokiarchaeota archaeon]|nr:hypothetical protein [Candidatus Lokiarchaeota archaeon]